jgi:hypothetical protein
MPLPSPSRKRSVIRWLLLPLAAILIAASPAEEIPKPDVFDVLGASPADVAASTSQPSQTDNTALIQSHTLSVFTPPRAAMIGQGPQAAMLARGAPFPGQSGIHPFVSILAESPWSQNIRDMRWLGPPDPAKFATLAKLRSLLENDPARTWIYDLLVAFDRLQLFIEAGRTSLPECTALAREVLFKFIDSNQPATTPTENIAIAVLSLDKQFQVFLTDLQARMTGAGRSELEIQRALFRLHRYRSVHRNNEAEPFALRIFELDPSDTEVLPEVLAAAVREKDSATTLKILQLHCQRHPDLFINLLADAFFTPATQDPIQNARPAAGRLRLVSQLPLIGQAVPQLPLRAWRGNFNPGPVLA